MGEFTRSVYGPEVDSLLKRAGRMPLDAGTPDTAAGERLRPLTPTELLAGQAVADVDATRACLSALWLRFGFLDESHRLSQGIATPEGSFWHAIMHRREGDYANAKYWFRRVGDHAVFAALKEKAADVALMGDGPAARAVAAQADWDPYAFVDLCEIVVAAGKPDDLLWCQVQRLEWDILFDHCWRAATGSGRVTP
ncbi:MAG: hypothetical protein IH626_23700 [Rhodospirillales bacterium]|nr:hypothetical protein [Rhodospirillales bacterium]